MGRASDKAGLCKVEGTRAHVGSLLECEERGASQTGAPFLCHPGTPTGVYDTERMPPVIEVSHLTKVFAGATAVDDISFQVDRGELLGFLGPNGAGKTTTIAMLLGIIYMLTLARQRGLLLKAQE